MPNTREKLIDRLPVDDAIRIFRDECKHRSEAYTEHLSYGGKGDPSEEVYIDALAMAVSALEQTKWIPVTERLPEENVRVLVCFRFTEYSQVEMDTDRIEKGKWYRWSKYVTHWMPLPEPPKGE